MGGGAVGITVSLGELASRGGICSPRMGLWSMFAAGPECKELAGDLRRLSKSQRGGLPFAPPYLGL